MKKSSYRVSAAALRALFMNAAALKDGERRNQRISNAAAQSISGLNAAAFGKIVISGNECRGADAGKI